VLVVLKVDVGCIQFLLDGIKFNCEKEVTNCTLRKIAAVADQTAIIKSTAIVVVKMILYKSARRQWL